MRILTHLAQLPHELCYIIFRNYATRELARYREVNHASDKLVREVLWARFSVIAARKIQDHQLIPFKHAVEIDLS